MVFSMFATVVSAAGPAEGQSAGEYLKELGVIKGNQDGDLKEDQTWKRQDIVVLLSRLLGVEEVAKNAAKTHEFTDVTDKNYDGYISWAVEKELVEGKGFGRFGFGDELKNQEFYALILRALTIEVDYADVPEKVVELGLAEEGLDFQAIPLRGATYETIVAALNTEVPGQGGKTLGEILGLIKVEAPALAASVVGTKKLELKFNKAVDKEKVEIEVKYSNTTLSSPREAAWAEDGKSVVLTYATNLPTADYTVTVKGVGEEDLTATFKVEDEKIEEIKFQSDKAPVSRKAAGDSQDFKEITVGYEVLNQYGENVAATTSLQTTSTKGTAVAANGVITISIGGAGFFNINEQVSVTLLHTSGAFAQATLTVSAEARVASASIVGVYHEDGKELVEGDKGAEYNLIVELKDQYGNALTNKDFAKADTVVTSSNPYVANINNAVSYSNKVIDGSSKLVLTFADALTPGTATITILTVASPARATYDVTVKAASVVDRLTLGQPASAPAGGTADIPFTAYDQFGNVIEHPTNNGFLSILLNGSSVGIGFTKDVVKNKTSLKAQLPTEPGIAQVVIVTKTNEIFRLNINVTAASKVASVGNVKDIDRTLLLNNTATITPAKVVIHDQYGAEKAVTLAASDSAAVGTYRIALESSNTANVELSASTLYDNGTVVVTAKRKGTATITAKLQEKVGNGNSDWRDVAGSSYNYTQRVVEKGDFTSYEATVAGAIHAPEGGTPATHGQKLEVKGVLGDGTKVAVPNSAANYTVVLPSYLVHDAEGNLKATSAPNYGEKKELEVPATVLISGATAVIETVTLKLSNVDPEATTFELRTNGLATKENDTTVSIAVPAAGTTVTATEIAEDAVKAKDQYGKDITPTFANAVATKTIDTNLKSGDTFTIATVTTNNKPFTFTVVVK